MKSFRWEVLLKFLNIFIISLITIAIYYKTTGFEFVLDDQIVIKDNSFVKKGLAGIKDIFTTDSFTGYFGEQQNLLEGGRYRPLSLIFFAAEYEAFGLNPFYFHLFNLVYYIILLVFTYFLILKLFELRVKDKVLLQILSLAGVLLFALHPVHTEAVANIKGRDEILSLLFSVIGMLLVFIYYDRKKLWLIALSLIMLLLAFLSKESSLVFVFLIPFSLYFFRESHFKELLSLTIILLIPVVTFFIIRYQALGFMFNTDIHETGIMNNPYINAGFGQKIATICFTLLVYLKLLFIPHPLTHDYYPYHIQILDISSGLGIVSLAAIILLIASGLYLLKEKKFISYFILFFLSSIFMMSNLLFNVGTFMNERFLFIASLVFPILIVLTGAYAFKYKSYFRSIYLVILMVILTGFTYKSYGRIPAWKDTESLNRAAVKVSINSARANCFMGVWLYEKMIKTDAPEEKQKLIDEARVFIDKSLSIYPEYKDALTMKAGIATQTYKLDNNLDELLDEFYEILSINYIAFVDEYIEWLVPRSPSEKINPFLYKTGYSLMAKKKGDLKKAEYYLNMGYKKDNTNKNILFGLTIVKYLSQKYKDAIVYGNQFISTDNSNADIFYYTGLSYNFNGEYDKGSKYLEKAYEINPALKKE